MHFNKYDSLKGYHAFCTYLMRCGKWMRVNLIRLIACFVVMLSRVTDSNRILSNITIRHLTK